MIVTIPASAGELFDKLTILQIKSERIEDPEKRARVAVERAALDQVAATVPISAALEAHRIGLLEVNVRLWEVEDDIRELERTQDFGPRFVQLARSVYRTNDERARIKKLIDLLLGSQITEEKSYRPY